MEKKESEILNKDITSEEILRNKKSLKLSVIEGSFNGAMDGFGSRYIIPYAILLGSSNLLIGLIGSLPALIGNLSQLFSLKLLKNHTRKKIVTYSALSQALFWIPIILLGYLFFQGYINNTASIFLVIFWSLLVTAGSIGIPAWSSWIKDLVITNNGTFFGLRNQFINLFTIFSMLLAGFLLGLFNEEKNIYGFFIIFSLALLCRLISFLIIQLKHEPLYTYDTTSYFSLKQFIKKMHSNNFGRFVLLVSAVSFSTGIAGPFFAVYMLVTLNLSYFYYTLILISSIITTIGFLPIWGKFADKYGYIKILKITSLLIGFVPFFWILSYPLMNTGITLIIYLFTIELFSGFIWSGFNLSAGHFIYDAVTRQRIVFCVSYFNILNSFGAFLGGLIGGLIALNNQLFGINTLLLIFFLSAALRFFFGYLIQGNIKEVRVVGDIKIKNIIKEKLNQGTLFLWRYINFRPIGLRANT